MEKMLWKQEKERKSLKNIAVDATIIMDRANSKYLLIEFWTRNKLDATFNNNIYSGCIEQSLRSR